MTIKKKALRTWTNRTPNIHTNSTAAATTANITTIIKDHESGVGLKNLERLCCGEIPLRLGKLNLKLKIISEFEKMPLCFT